MMDFSLITYKAQILEALDGLMAIESVKDEPQVNMPYGKGVFDALLYILNLAEKLDFDYETLEKRVVEACLDYEACPYEAEVNILFTNDEEIRQINNEYRSIDAPTDVLSFPGAFYEIPGDFSKLEENTADYFHPETGELLLGDIVISVDRAELQAKEYGHSIEREIAFLTTHSMFHLFGYDHMEEEERVRMDEKQDKLLERLNILR
jgi:probable rRNA maturation factor